MHYKADSQLYIAYYLCTHCCHSDGLSTVRKKQLLGSQRLTKVHNWSFRATRDPWGAIGCPKVIFPNGKRVENPLKWQQCFYNR